MQGCCADKKCTPETCMDLPAGKTCGDCVREYRCCAIFGHKPEDTYCDWFPRRFREAKPKPCFRCGGNYDDRDSGDDRICPKCDGSGVEKPK